ncbi:MAG: hypothetical protein KAJ91_04815 [Candidatus Aenigmarchaeota archaeon]|nr:hypothetical protein [Candidatus Aenigmarchaeota archaeon]
MALNVEANELRELLCGYDSELNTALVGVAKRLPKPMILTLNTDTNSKGTCVLYKTTAEFMPFTISSEANAKPIDEIINQILLTHNIYSPDQSQSDEDVVFFDLPLYKELEGLLSPGYEYDYFGQLLQKLSEQGLEQLSSHMYMQHPKDVGGKYVGEIMTNHNPELQDMRSFRVGRFKVCDYQVI